MKTNTNGQAEGEATVNSTGRSRRVLPPEAAATVLAISAVMLGVLLELPIYGIFLGWAAAGLAGTSGTVSMPVLGRCLAVGAVFGAAVLSAQATLEQLLGPGVPLWVYTVAALAVANPLMVLLGRTPMFGSVPGMFIGFSTLFAVQLGSLTPMTNNILGALAVSMFTNLTGLAVHWAFGRLTRSSPRRI